MAIILLVDNDPMQASMRKSILERRFQSFQSIERVADAVDALCLIEQPQFAGQLGLVISGLDMPGISGPAFVAELQDRLPWVPVLVLGAAGESAADYAGALVRFLSRPVVSEDLLTAAEELLGSHAAQAA